MNKMNWTPKKIADWHKKTFPNITEKYQRMKCLEELYEYVESGDIEELVDVYICCVALSVRFKNYIYNPLFQYEFMKNKIDPKEMDKAVELKMEKNVNRVWDVDNGSFHHKEEK